MKLFWFLFELIFIVDEQDGFSFLTTSLPDSDKYKSNKQFTGPHIELRK